MSGGGSERVASQPTAAGEQSKGLWMSDEEFRAAIERIQGCSR